MQSNTPLTDTDRWDWLARLREAGVEKLEGNSEGVVIACSALKRSYRDVFRSAAGRQTRINVHFVYLHANEVSANG